MLTHQSSLYVQLFLVLVNVLLKLGCKNELSQHVRTDVCTEGPHQQEPGLGGEGGETGNGSFLGWHPNEMWVMKS